MNNTLIRTLLVLLVLLVVTPAAQAGTMMFGSDDKIVVIEDVGESGLVLGYRITNYYFIAGIFMKDNGYVLQSKGEKNKYISLSNDMLMKLQEKGLYVNGLPPYSISIWRYVWGYLLWVVLALVIGGPILVNYLKEKMKGPPEVKKLA